MKITKLLLIPMLMLLISSCGKDLSEELEGSWGLSTYEIADCPDEGISAITVTGSNGCLSLFGDQLCVTIVFDGMTGGTLTEGDGQDNDSNTFTYTANNDTNSGTICSGQNECLDYTYDNDSLVLSSTEDGCPVNLTFIRN